MPGRRFFGLACTGSDNAAAGGIMSAERSARLAMLAFCLIFAVVMIWQLVASHLRYREARRRHEEAYRRVRAAIDRGDVKTWQAALENLREQYKR
jgi:hypothetical protein